MGRQGRWRRLRLRRPAFDGTGDEACRERWLEIKTTNGPRTNPFFITKNELCVSKERPDIFRIVRLYDFRRQARAYRIEPPLEEHVWLSPMIYRASLTASSSLPTVESQ